jgi:hypothetical protein
MVTAITHSKLFVLDQDEVLDAPGQPGHPIYLEKPAPPAMSEETAEQVRDLLAKGALGFVALQTDDCRKLYEAWKARRAASSS